MKRPTAERDFARAYAKAMDRLDAAIEQLLIERTRLAVEMGQCLERKAREAGKVAGALVAIALLLACKPAPSQAQRLSAPAGTPPNVLLVLTDDQDVGTLDVMPQLASLWAAQGVTFNAAFAASPLCSPGRAALLTGQHAHNHGVWNNGGGSGGGYGALDYATTLPVWLKGAGYDTAFMGKFMNDYGLVNAPGKSGPPCDEIPAGWDTWFTFITAANNNLYNHYLTNTNGSVVQYGNAQVPPGCSVDSVNANAYSTDKLAQRASNWITNHASTGPWFLVVAPYAPHNSAGQPIPAPRHNGAFAGDPFPIPGSPNYNEADVTDKPAVVQAFPLLTPTDTALRATFHRKRRESLLAVDELVAGVEAAIVASSQGARTVRIFSSDNGWLNGEHRIPGLKTFVYEESARVPLIVRGPGYGAGVTSPELVGQVDLAPTIVALAGASASRTMDGADLGPLLRGEPVEWRSALLIESRQNASYDAVRTQGHLYAEHTSGESELYDMAADPGQLASLHADPAFDSVKAALAAQLQTLRFCVGSGCFQ